MYGNLVLPRVALLSRLFARSASIRVLKVNPPHGFCQTIRWGRANHALGLIEPCVWSDQTMRQVQDDLIRPHFMKCGRIALGASTCVLG